MKETIKYPLTKIVLSYPYWYKKIIFRKIQLIFDTENLIWKCPILICYLPEKELLKKGLDMKLPTLNYVTL